MATITARLSPGLCPSLVTLSAHNLNLIYVCKHLQQRCFFVSKNQPGGWLHYRWGECGLSWGDTGLEANAYDNGIKPTKPDTQEERQLVIRRLARRSSWGFRVSDWHNEQKCQGEITQRVFLRQWIRMPLRRVRVLLTPLIADSRAE